MAKNYQMTFSMAKDVEEAKGTNNKTYVQSAFRDYADKAYDENIQERGKELLAFAMKRQYDSNSLPLMDEEALYDLQMHLKKTIRNLQENDSKYCVANAIQMANALLREVINEPKFMILYNYFWFVKKNYSILKNYRDTYLLLATITQLADGWDESAELQVELASILAK